MNLKALHYAILLKRVGSFSQAAYVAEVSQSAISQQISKLEDDLNLILFDRQAKPIKVTEAGEGFLQRAEALVLEAEHLWEYASEVSSKVEGHIDIGIIPTLSPYLSPLFIKELRQAYPGLQLSIHELKTLEIVAGLSERRLQAGVIATPISSRIKLEAHVLFYERFYIYTSAKSRFAKRKSISLDDISASELWLLNEGNCLSDQVRRICTLKNKPIDHGNSLCNYHTDSLDALRNFITHSDGLTIIPELATASVAPQDEDLIKKITGKPRVREISLIHLKGAMSNRLSKLIVDHIQRSIPRRMLSQGTAMIVDPHVTI